jgi:hypothetical protein
MRSLCLVLAGMMALPLPPVVYGQEPAHKLSLVIVEGDGAINNIRQRTAREPIVQVEDENHKPIAGAAVIFLLPTHGAGGAFSDGSHTLSVVTDSQGRAVARGIMPNNVKGQFQIQVKVSYNNMTTTGTIAQTNAVVAGTTGTVATGVSAKLIVILAVAAAAAAGGAYYAATHGGGNGNTTTTTGTTITAGSGTVGPPK